MGNCVWTKILDKQLIKAKDGAALYKVQFQEGLAPHMNDGGHCNKGDNFSESKDLQKSIHWYSPSSEFVFCSNKLPAVITTNAKIIPLSSNSMSYGRANIISVYAPVCHNVSTNEFLSKKFQDDNHYTDSGLEMVMVKNPERMFEFLDSKVLAAYANKF